MGSKGLHVGKQAPGFSLPDVNGQQRSLEEFENQAVIIVFLRGTW